MLLCELPGDGVVIAWIPEATRNFHCNARGRSGSGHVGASAIIYVAVVDHECDGVAALNDLQSLRWFFPRLLLPEHPLRLCAALRQFVL